jgi:hypothetical protein
MATIKPNTILKDQLIKKETAKIAKRAADAKALNTLLTSLPKVDPAVAQLAVDDLMDAADQYKTSQPLVDAQGRRSKPSIAKARASMAALHKQLAKAQEQLVKAQELLSSLPLNAKTAIGNVTDAPIGKMIFDIAQVCQAVEKALDELAARPNKVTDAARSILAYRVAVVFRDILKKKPSSTQAKQLKENKSRGGAAYDRVLRATLKAAGVINYGSGLLIAAGLRLLNDPNLPPRG